MPFHPLDLVKAKQPFNRQDPLLLPFKSTQPYHGILHTKTNRLIAISKFKNTANLLSNLTDIQAFTDLYLAGHLGADFTEIIFENYSMPYCLKIISNNAPIRWSSEKKIVITDVIKTDNIYTWDIVSLKIERVVELILKAATLDKIYERLNWARSGLATDILLDDAVQYHRYQQALKFQNGEIYNLSLLEMYADDLGVELSTAANHCIFCYNENVESLARSEKIKMKFEKLILASESLKELQLIDYRWHHLVIGKL